MPWTSEGVLHFRVQPSSSPSKQLFTKREQPPVKGGGDGCRPGTPGKDGISNRSAKEPSEVRFTGESSRLIESIFMCNKIDNMQRFYFKI